MKPEEAIRFLRQFQELLAEGGFVATYKFALLQALADLSVEEPSSPDGSLRLHVEQLADKFIEYYWNQVAPFDQGQIRQNAGRQAKVIRLVQEYRQDVGPRLADLRASTPEWRLLRNQVANVIIEMPLWKLQKIGNETKEFLYRHSDEVARGRHFLRPTMVDPIREPSERRALGAEAPALLHSLHG